MAMYVMLAFDDDTEAADFVQAVQDRYHGGSRQILFPVEKTIEDGSPEYKMEPLPQSTFVRGQYRRPTNFCMDQSHRSGGAKKAGWVRGAKYGWWICSVCHKPGPQWGQGDAWYTSLGKNLLPVSAEAPEWRGEGRRGHKWDDVNKEWVRVAPPLDADQLGVHVSMIGRD
jgi:hypothetical protein